MEERLYHLWFAELNIPKRIKSELLNYYGSLECLWNTPEREFTDLLGHKYTEKITAERNEEKIFEYSNRLAANAISYIYPGHDDYPTSLMNIPDRPEILYFKGKIKPLNANNIKRLAVVGARKATAYGIQVVNQIIDGLAGYNVQIISGLAYGIDVNAHKAALLHDMYTVGILGCGVDVIYPVANTSVYRKMEEQGALISEYRPGAKPENWHFPMRNRIISGLADAVLVVEAREKSGSLITADQALEQGREVFTIPGRINDLNSKGTNNLIKQGANVVTDASDIIDVLGIDKKCSKGENQMNLFELHQTKITLAPEEKKVYSCVRLEPGHIDEICRASGLGVADTLKILYELELKGLIYEPAVNNFSRKGTAWQNIL